MRLRYFLPLFFALALGLSEKGWAYSYGPACQWVHLVGEVVLPQDKRIARPIGLTVTYQSAEMKHPATLLTNFPLPGEEFKIFLAGFDEEIAGAFFVSPMFNFTREILFRYYAKSADGKWRSDFFQSRYVPASIPPLDLPKNHEQAYRCNTKIDLDPLVLKQK